MGTPKIMFPCTLLEESTRERASDYSNDRKDTSIRTAGKYRKLRAKGRLWYVMAVCSDTVNITIIGEKGESIHKFLKTVLSN